jgi:hypothetical protein
MGGLITGLSGCLLVVEFELELVVIFEGVGCLVASIGAFYLSQCYPLGMYRICFWEQLTAHTSSVKRLLHTRRLGSLPQKQAHACDCEQRNVHVNLLSGQT